MLYSWHSKINYDWVNWKSAKRSIYSNKTFKYSNRAFGSLYSKFFFGNAGKINRQVFEHNRLKPKDQWSLREPQNLHWPNTTCSWFETSVVSATMIVKEGAVCILAAISQSTWKAKGLMILLCAWGEVLFHLIHFKILGLSSPWSFSNYKKFKFEPSLEPRNGRLCLPKTLHIG